MNKRDDCVARTVVQRLPYLRRRRRVPKRDPKVAQPYPAGRPRHFYLTKGEKCQCLSCLNQEQMPGHLVCNKSAVKRAEISQYPALIHERGSRELKTCSIAEVHSTARLL